LSASRDQSDLAKTDEKERKIRQSRRQNSLPNDMIQPHNIHHRFPQDFPRVLLIYLAPVLDILTCMKLSKTFLTCSFVYPLVLALLSFNALAQGAGYAIQVASTTTQSEAQTIVNGLKEKGVDAYLLKALVRRKGTRYRVRIGRFRTQLEAKEAGELALSRGLISEFITTTYDPPAIAKSSLKEPKTKPATPQPSPEPEPAKIERKIEQGLAAAEEPAAKEPAAKEPAAKEPPKGLNDDAPADVPRSGDATTPGDSESVSEIAIGNPPPAEGMIDLAVNNRNWRVARRGASADKNLKAVYFVDSITGWVAGEDGATFRTTDGGRSWKPLLSGAPANIDFIYFADWSNGWMLGESNENKVAGRLLFTTNNGGRSWRHKPLPKVMSLHFIDKLNGWAVGRDATAFKTANGGEEWTRITGWEELLGLPIESSTGNFGLQDVFFLNADNGWMIGNFYGRGSSSIGGLFVTSDGGKSWKQMPLKLADSSGQPIPGELQSVRFSDVNTGTVAGEMYDGDARFFFALHTRDGGRTWEQHRTPSRATHSTRFIDLSNGWSAASAPREGSTNAAIYDTTLIRTDDGGKTWQNDFIARGGRIRNLFFLSPTKGWAVGDRGMILQYAVGSRQ
jgi:photosystem II stability/assembly factor-like uncharacterized protein